MSNVTVKRDCKISVNTINFKAIRLLWMNKSVLIVRTVKGGSGRALNGVEDDVASRGQNVALLALNRVRIA